jgi:hypothetical protein
MSWNMPEGCSPADYDRYMGYGQPDPDISDYDAYQEALDNAIPVALATDDSDPLSDPFAGNSHVAEPFRSALQMWSIRKPAASEGAGRLEDVA